MHHFQPSAARMLRQFAGSKTAWIGELDGHKPRIGSGLKSIEERHLGEEVSEVNAGVLDCHGCSEGTLHHDDAAVVVDGGAGHEARSLGSHKEHHLGMFFRPSKTSDGNGL